MLKLKRIATPSQLFYHMLDISTKCIAISQKIVHRYLRHEAEKAKTYTKHRRSQYKNS